MAVDERWYRVGRVAAVVTWRRALEKVSSCSQITKRALILASPVDAKIALKRLQQLVHHIGALATGIHRRRRVMEWIVDGGLVLVGGDGSDGLRRLDDAHAPVEAKSAADASCRSRPMVVLLLLLLWRLLLLLLLLLKLLL